MSPEIMSDKDFFKNIKKESKDYSDNIEEGFPYFCLKIFWDSLSNDDIQEALLGLKTNDDSIDAFVVDEETKEINIIQCKSCQSEKAMKPMRKEWLSYLGDVPGKLKDDDYIDNHNNERIKEIAKEFKITNKKGFKVKLHLFHLGKGNRQIEQHYQNIDVYDWHKIKEKYQEYLSRLDRTEPPEITIQLGKFSAINPPISQKHRTLVSIITGDELIKLREAYRYKLFDKNLRFSLGKNKINRAIMETAKSEPENFYFYNNGITITSKGFRCGANNSTVKIQYPQIINGAQTVNAIYEAYKEKENRLSRQNEKDSSQHAKAEFERIKILFRIIQDDTKDGYKTSGFEEKVIRYNNSQNTIKETDFYANNPEQIRLQELFSDYDYFYEIKRGDRKYLEDNPKYEHNLLKKKKSDFKFFDEKIEIEKLASLWMAYYIDPSLNNIKKGSIFGYADDKYYQAVFEEADKMSNDLVKEMILAYNLFDVISKQTDIYSNKLKTGQILAKMAQIDDKGDTTHRYGTFKNIQEIVQGSFVFKEQVKITFSNKEKFLNEREAVFQEIRDYQFFSKGKYLTLYIFAFIIKECEYKKQLIDEKLRIFSNKEFIGNIVREWLPTILQHLMKPEYDEFDKEVGSGQQTFYNRISTKENIEKKFKRLHYKLNRDIKDIFPLKFQ